VPTPLPTYRTPALTPGQHRALDQGLLPFMLKFGGRAKVSVREAASELRLSEDFIRDLCQVGELEYIRAGAKGEAKKYIILTRSLILWCLKNSNVNGDDLHESLRQLVALYDAPVLRFVVALANARLERLTR
jgi:hypothetical protein